MPEDSGRLTQLVYSFHCLTECPHQFLIPLFRPDDFARWAAKTQGGGGMDAALFILSIQNRYFDWSSNHGLERHGSGQFNASGAMSNWDASMREAFIAWASDPWWIG